MNMKLETMPDEGDTVNKEFSAAIDHIVPKIAVYPGSFDPVTNGHIDVVQRASRLFGTVIMAVANNPRKMATFSVDERVEMIREATSGLSNVRVDSFETLLIVYAGRTGARAVIRGLRAISDYDYEFQMALMNKKLEPGIDTIFLVTRADYLYVSSSMVKEVFRLDGDIGHLVPISVLERMKRWKAGGYR